MYFTEPSQARRKRFPVDPVFLPSDGSAEPPFCIEMDPCDVCGGHACGVFSCRTFEDDRHPLEEAVPSGGLRKVASAGEGYRRIEYSIGGAVRNERSRSHQLRRSRRRLERQGR